MIKTPPVEGKENSDVFLIRHGFSEFNAKHLVLIKEGENHGEKHAILKADPAMVDPNLHPIGVH